MKSAAYLQSGEYTMRIDVFSVTKLIPTAGIWMVVVTACVFSATAFAQSAQQILDSLDADDSGAISKDEAVDDMKTNFSFIDTNGDGGIDLEELDAILKMVASQNGESAPTAQAPGAQRSSGDLSYGKSNPDAGSFINVSPEDDTMLYILNLMKFREKAEYDDSRETELTGRESDQLYDPMPAITKVGGGLVYAGEVKEQMVNPGPAWDSVAIVMYPSRKKLMEMNASAEWNETAVHKSASLEVSQIMITTPHEWTFSEKQPLAAKDIPYPLPHRIRHSPSCISSSIATWPSIPQAATSQNAAVVMPWRYSRSPSREFCTRQA